jgi:hypothetical protein
MVGIGVGEEGKNTKEREGKLEYHHLQHPWGFLQ